jgi:hypothetical protein
MKAMVRVYRVVTFVPTDYLEQVLESVLRIDALTYSQYDRLAWWSSEGTEQFRPLAEAQPTVGSSGEVARVRSIRLELSIARDLALLERIVEEGIRPQHPWKEPVIVVYEAIETRCQTVEPSRESIIS